MAQAMEYLHQQLLSTQQAVAQQQAQLGQQTTAYPPGDIRNHFPPVKQEVVPKPEVSPRMTAILADQARRQQIAEQERALKQEASLSAVVKDEQTVTVLGSGSGSSSGGGHLSIEQLQLLLQGTQKKEPKQEVQAAPITTTPATAPLLNSENGATDTNKLILSLLNRIQELEKLVPQEKTHGAGMTWPPPAGEHGVRFYLVPDSLVKGDKTTAVICSGEACAKDILKPNTTVDSPGVLKFACLYEAIISFFTTHQKRYVVQIRR